MNCPYCGQPMEVGWIMGADRILCVPWIPQDAKQKIFSRRNVIKCGGLIMRDNPFPAFPKKETFICRQCRKGVFSFHNDKGDIDDYD